MSYTFDENIVSDLHKDAYGFRPRSDFWSMWDSYSNDEKQVEWDSLCDVMENSINEEKREQERAVADFETLVASTISYGAGNRVTALRWLTSEEKFNHEQSVECWVWNKGLLFTDTGRTLVKDLCAMYGINKFEFA